MPDPGFDEFMFSENYKELFNKIPVNEVPEECPNRSEYVYECPCMYVYMCKAYSTLHPKKDNI
jgi:hypothetical protein